MTDLSPSPANAKAPAAKRPAAKRPAAKAPAAKAPAAKAPAAKRRAATRPAVERTVVARPIPAVSVSMAVEPVVRTAGAPFGRLRVKVPRDALPAHLPKLRVPMTDLRIPLPDRQQLPWLAGLFVVAALDVIDWPVVAVLTIGHTIITHSRNESLRQLAEGLEAGV